jgi:hypothetical protein
MPFELMPEPPEGWEANKSDPRNNDADLYEEPCDYCGGKVWSTGGSGYYNGSYQCYTLYLECENCGPYEVECV